MAKESCTKTCIDAFRHKTIIEKNYENHRGPNEIVTFRHLKGIILTKKFLSLGERRWEI